MAGAVAAVAVGGAWALPALRKPSGSAFPGKSLPVADVPDPTDQPVELVYCAGWDPVARAPVSPMSESIARAQDAAGDQYAVVAFVGGVARAVVEVCWSAHHAELWNIDTAGRRYRGVAYRRWPDGRLRLFEVRSWNYTGPDKPEFDGDRPTFKARVRRNATAAMETIGISAVLSDGTTLETDRDRTQWPERVRPPEDVAVPAVDGWPGLVGMTGPVTGRSGPAVVPARFPWRPPRPRSPRLVAEMTTHGTRLRAADGQGLTVERIPAGTIRLPSGRMVVADPAWLDAATQPLAARVSPGEYPVEVFQLTGRAAAMTAACRVTVTGAPVTSWRLALRDGDHELALGDGEFFGNPVDGATLSLVDHSGATAYSPAEIEAAMGGNGPYHTISAKTTGTNLIIVPGWSDGAFPVWLGHAADGALSCVVLDFLIPDLATAQPG